MLDDPEERSERRRIGIDTADAKQIEMNGARQMVRAIVLCRTQVDQERRIDDEDMYRRAHTLAHQVSGAVHRSLSQEDAAVAAYHQAIAADPDCEDAYFNLSRLYERRGERAFALRALRTYRNLTRRP